MFFTPRYVKEARHYCEAARRIIRYRLDLLTREQVGEIEKHIDALDHAASARDRKAVTVRSEELERVVGRIAPPRSHAGLRENIEVFLVAIVIAAGVRSYLIEPFKIPTGSMQPTLYGLTGQRLGPDTPLPNPLVRAFQFVVQGRTFLNTIAKEDDIVVDVTEKSYLNYFTFSQVRGQRSSYTIFAPAAVLRADFGVAPTRVLKKGQPIARGYVDNGDFVLVNKLAYNFSSPSRADVFVFRTTGIRYIERTIPAGLGSQHYIKRLAGIPGDTLRIAEPDLFIDGALATEPAFRRVMGMKNGYGGYTNEPSSSYLSEPGQSVTIPAKRYFALGDNSAHSSDSRFWGFVAEKNVTGKAFVVFWPFTARWGFIE